MNEFDQWYHEMFGNMPGSADEANKLAVRKIWSSVLVNAAEEFEFNDFETYTGHQIGRVLRRMARGSHGTEDI